MIAAAASTRAAVPRANDFICRLIRLPPTTSARQSRSEQRIEGAKRDSSTGPAAAPPRSETPLFFFASLSVTSRVDWCCYLPKASRKHPLAGLPFLLAPEQPSSPDSTHFKTCKTQCQSRDLQRSGPHSDARQLPNLGRFNPENGRKSQFAFYHSKSINSSCPP